MRNPLSRIAIAAYAALWMVLAVHPAGRSDWLLENALVVVLWLVLAVLHRRFRLTDASLCLILCYLALHAIGAHYTYSDVPYDRWLQAWTGHSLDQAMGWDRNQYDRLVHFGYGLLLIIPIREFLVRMVELKGFWSYFLPLDVTLSTSALYELIEWGTAEFFGGDLGVAYLGTQGDVWDAQKDMALAALGALVALLVCWLWERRTLS